MKIKSCLFFMIFILFTQSCSTLVSRSVYPFKIETIPNGANIKVTNRKGKEVFNGNSPVTLALRSGAGFFKKEKYLVTISMEGYAKQSFPITAKLDGWYAGNLIFGGFGFLGFLVVDPMTGAMYKLRGDFIKIKLDKEDFSTLQNELRIYDFASLPDEWKEHLERIDVD